MADMATFDVDGTPVDTNRGIGMGGDLFVAHVAGRQVEQTYADRIGAATRQARR